MSRNPDNGSVLLVANFDSGVGFAAGMERLLLARASLGLQPQAGATADVFVVGLGDDAVVAKNSLRDPASERAQRILVGGAAGPRRGALAACANDTGSCATEAEGQGFGGDQHCRRAHILAHLRQRVMDRACQVHDGFDGGVDKLGGEDHRHGQDEDRPIAGGKSQPEGEDEDQRGDHRMDPGVVLGLEHIAPAAEGMPK